MNLKEKKRRKRSIIYFLILALFVQIVMPLSVGHIYAMEDKTELEAVDELAGEFNQESSSESMETATGSAITIKSTVQTASSQALYITNVEIKDEYGNDFTGEVKVNSKIDLRYVYSIPDEEEVDTDLVHTLTLPEEIKIIENKEFDLMHGSRAIAKVKLSTNNTITYQFYEAVNDEAYMYDREGFIQVYSEFDESKVGNDGPKDIIFEIPGNSSITVHVDFEKKDEKVDVSIAKSGSYNTFTNEITWTINVKPSSEPNLIPIANVVITDVIPSDQTFIDGSTTFNGVNTSNNFSYDGYQTLLYTFNDSINTTNNDNYVITFKTKANTDAFEVEGDRVYFKNKANLSYLDNLSTVVTKASNEGSVDTTVNFIEKTGTYVAVGQEIHWTVTINNNNLNVKNAQIIDSIPVGLELDKASIKVVKKSGAVAADGAVQENPTNAQLLIYNFNTEIKESYVLTYTTKVVDPDAYNTNNKVFTNNAEFKGIGVPNNAKVGVDVGITTNVISKAGKGYNRTTHEITWEIIVNQNKIAIDNAVIIDNIPKGLEYVPGSFKVDGTTITPDDTFYTPITGDQNRTGNITYDFGNINKTYVVTFKTKVLDNTSYAVNGSKSYTNSVTLSGIHPVTGEHIGATVNAPQTVTSEVIKKTALEYDHITREQSWQIVVNQNKMPMEGAYVEDTIGKYEKLVEGSVKINGNVAKLGSNANEKDAYYYNTTTNKLTYNFTDNITEQQIITFKTVIVDLSIFELNTSKTLTNTAILKGNDIPDNVTSTANKTIPNVVVEKKGTYISGQDYIDWVVNINQNKLEIANPVLEDVLQAGLELDAATVKLIKLDTAANGNFIEGEDVTKSLLKVSYDMNTRKVVFEFQGKIESAHRLTFRTDIDPTYNHTTFNNTILLKGGSSTQSGSASAISVSFQTGGGGASGTGRGSIAVTKVDSNTRTPLAGATFELLDMYMNPTKTSTVTGIDGKVLFNGLKFGNQYYIREKTAPTGYVLSDEVFEFTVKDEEGLKNIVYDFKNEKIKGNVQFTKVDEVGSLLSGAVFTMFKFDDVAYSNPVANATSNSDGEVEFKDIVYGKYIIKETKAPDGYILSDQIITAEIGDSDNGVIVMASPTSVSNQIIRGNIGFYKFNEVSQPLQGAEFSIFSAKDTSYTTSLGSATSDSDGKVEFKNMEYGNYIIKETKAPAGYALYDQIITAEIGINDNEKTVTANPSKIVNQRVKGNIMFTKVDGTGKLLKGALFSLYYATDAEYTTSIGSAMSDFEGIVEFVDVEYGKYIIKEIKAPEGYILSKEVLTAQIGDFDNGNTVIASPSSISNQIIKGNITFTKVDEAGKPLQGAVFTIYKSDDINYNSPYGTATSNTVGIVEFKNIEYGNYHIKETVAPNGYQLTDQIIVVEIGMNDNGKTIVTSPDSITNKKAIIPVLPTPVPEIQGPSEPIPTPGEPTPSEPTVTPDEPSPTPNEPTVTPGKPTPTPSKPTSTPQEPTPELPRSEQTTKNKSKEGFVDIPEDGVPKISIPANHGKVTVDKDGKWVYQPNSDFVGKDKFTITIDYPDETQDEILIEIEVDDTPLGTDKLPKTGETLQWKYYFYGAIIFIIGVTVLSVRKKKENI